MCKLCETKPVYEFTNKRKVCASCFVRYFEKKVLATMRKFGMVQRGEKIGYLKGEGLREVVLEEVLEMFGKKAYVEIVSGKRGVNKIAIADTIDVNSEKIIVDIIKGKAKFKGVDPNEKKIVKPLYLFLDEEVLLYAKLKKLKFVAPVGRTPKNLRKKIFTKGKKKNDKISNFINDLEKKHKEVKYSVVNSFLELK
jgi:hypothetical protein